MAVIIPPISYLLTVLTIQGSGFATNLLRT